MRKEKINRNILIYRKWRLLLLDIKCRLESADILPPPTFAINKDTIPGTLNIVQELAKRLELSDKVIRSKLILFKGDLITVQN